MKIIRRTIALMLCVVTVSAHQSYADVVQTQGFVYNPTAYDDIEFTNGRVMNVYDDDDLVGSMTSVFGRMVSNQESYRDFKEEYILCKMYMEPYANVRAKKWGVSELSYCNMHFPTGVGSGRENLWTPYSVGLTSQRVELYKAGYLEYVGATINKPISNIFVTGEMQSSKRMFEITYDYEPSRTRNPFDQSKKRNKTFANPLAVYGIMSVYSKRRGDVQFDLKAEFSYAKDSNARPAYTCFETCDEECVFKWKNQKK